MYENVTDVNSMLGFLPGMGIPEMILIFIVVLVIFGPNELPGIFRKINTFLNQVRMASQEFKHEMMDVERELRQEASEFTEDVQTMIEGDIEEYHDEHDHHDFHHPDHDEMEEYDYEADHAGLDLEHPPEDSSAPETDHTPDVTPQTDTVAPDLVDAVAEAVSTTPPAERIEAGGTAPAEEPAPADTPDSDDENQEEKHEPAS